MQGHRCTACVTVHRPAPRSLAAMEANANVNHAATAATALELHTVWVRAHTPGATPPAGRVALSDTTDAHQHRAASGNRHPPTRRLAWPRLIGSAKRLLGAAWRCYVPPRPSRYSQASLSGLRVISGPTRGPRTFGLSGLGRGEAGTSALPLSLAENLDHSARGKAPTLADGIGTSTRLPTV